MSITLKKLLIFGGCLILVGGVSFYFYQQNKPDPEPVEIYNTPKRVKKQAPSATIPPNPDALSEGGTREDAQTAEEQPSSETPAPSVTHTVPPEKKDDVLSDEAIQKWVTEVMEDLEQLNTQFMEKYPELLEISKMTQEEFLEKYATPEEQQALLEYVQSVQPEMFAELRAVFSSLPIEIVDDILLEAKDHFIQIWGQEAADHVIRQLRTELGL